MQYYPLDSSNVVDYLSEMSQLNKVFSSFTGLQVEEITDGNMNYAYLVSNRLAPQESVFVKQSPPYIKVMGQDWPLTQTRMNAEINAFKFYQQVVPDKVPKLYFNSKPMACMVMQNLTGCDILRHQLMAKQSLPNLVRDMAEFFAKTLWHSSELCLGAKNMHSLIGKSANHAMCQITQDFVFTYPFEEHAMNDRNRELPQSVIDGIVQDPEVRAHIGQMKYLYLSKKQALLHGDLHTGSIMASADKTYVIDPEFAFVGPMGFDLGAFIANLYINYFSHAHNQNEEAQQYSQWLLQAIEQFWQQFQQQFLALWHQHEQHSEQTFIGHDISQDGNKKFNQLFLQDVLSDTLGFAACKMLRRILGVAKVADLLQFDDLKLRAKLETQAISMAKQILITRHTFDDLAEVNWLAQSIAGQK